MLAGSQAGRDGEHGAAGVVDVLVQGVARQRRLELDELGWVLHERDEEQAAEQGPALRVDAVGEGVAAAQDMDSAVVLGAGQPDVGVGGDAPGQLIVYVPGWTVSEKPPESPGVRFSCSPRMWALSEVRSSASDTEPAPELVTLKSTAPAGTLAGLGSQPSDVRLIVTVLDLSPLAAPAPVDSFAFEPELEHPDATSARLAATIAAAAPRRLVRIPSLLTIESSLTLD
jgi:hypothetical protein